MEQYFSFVQRRIQLEVGIFIKTPSRPCQILMSNAQWPETLCRKMQKWYCGNKKEGYNNVNNNKTYLLRVAYKVDFTIFPPILLSAGSSNCSPTLHTHTHMHTNHILMYRLKEIIIIRGRSHDVFGTKGNTYTQWLPDLPWVKCSTFCFILEKVTILYIMALERVVSRMSIKHYIMQTHQPMYHIPNSARPAVP